MKMKLLFAFLLGGILSASAQKTVVDVAVSSKDHTTLVAAVTAADLVSTLQSVWDFPDFSGSFGIHKNFPPCT